MQGLQPVVGYIAPMGVGGWPLNAQHRPSCDLSGERTLSDRAGLTRATESILAEYVSLDASSPARANEVVMMCSSAESTMCQSRSRLPFLGAIIGDIAACLAVLPCGYSLDIFKGDIYDLSSRNQGVRYCSVHDWSKVAQKTLAQFVFRVLHTFLID